MIKAALARWHTMTAAGRDRSARELSKWSRATLAVTIGFGTLLMLLGGLFTYGLATAGYELLNRGGLRFDSQIRHYVSIWAIVLLLLYGGNFIRAIGWRELRRPRSDVSDEVNRKAGATGAAIVGVLLAPLLLFWGALGVISFVRDFHMLFSRPAWARPSLGMALTSGDIWVLSAWWLLTIAWLAGGVGLIWRGIHALHKRPVSRS